MSSLAGVAGSLRILSLQSNRLTSMTGLEVLTSLEELYLSHNGLSEIQVQNYPRTHKSERERERERESVILLMLDFQKWIAIALRKSNDR